ESASGTGTVVVRSPSGARPSSLFSSHSSVSSSILTSSEDPSISGTFVYRSHYDDSDSPKTPKSRLGLKGRSSSAAAEDSDMNLAEAKAAIQRGRKSNVRERPTSSHVSRDLQQSRTVEQPSESPDIFRIITMFISHIRKLSAQVEMTAMRRVIRCLSLHHYRNFSSPPFKTPSPMIHE
ncbi:hypothetical protein M569_11106, partial [Genlisea aurea]